MSNAKYAAIDIKLKHARGLLALSKRELESLLKQPESSNKRMFAGLKQDLANALLPLDDEQRRRFLRNLCKYRQAYVDENDPTAIKTKQLIEKKKKNQEIINSIFNELKAEHPHRTDNILRRAASCKRGQDKSYKRKYEDLFAKILDDMGFKYERQKIFMNSYSFYIVDFYLPEYNVVCEVDGFSHASKAWMDEARTRVLINQNKVRDVIRFFNDEVDDSPSQCMETLDIILSNL